ncbi:hypothetical protein [Streptomyces sp. NPDC005423]|uniref:hypothetical protein n=1 Tax=Streptomyces sp. NPDC005423 TaxID=3155343 RepID=UPI0033BCF904
MNSTELLAALQAQQDEAAAQASELRDRMENLSADLTGTEARLTESAIARKVIAELGPTGPEPDPPEQATAYQAILNAFNQHPDQTFRVRELHELLGMPTDDPAVNVTRSASDAPPAKASSPNPREATTRNGLNAL